jgi:hypothetical protein
MFAASPAPVIGAHDGERIHEPILDAHPHACALGGIVLLEVAIWNEETGEEGTHLQSIPCRRCAEAPENGNSFSTGAS